MLQIQLEKSIYKNFKAEQQKLKQLLTIIIYVKRVHEI